MWTDVTDPDATKKEPEEITEEPAEASTEKKGRSEEAPTTEDGRQQGGERPTPGPDLDAEAATAALAAGYLTGRAPWMGYAFGQRAAEELESVAVPPAQAQLPVQAPTIDRRVPQEPKFFDTPVEAASGAILAILQRPYLWPSGALPGDPGRLVSASTQENMRHIASPPAWRSTGRGRRR